MAAGKGPTLAGTSSLDVTTVQGDPAGVPIPTSTASSAGVVADVITGDTGQNGAVVYGGGKTVAFTTTTVQAVGTTDALNYAWASVHIVTQGGSSTVTFQGSNDNTNWVSVGLFAAGSVGTSVPAVSTTSASTILHGPLGYRYFRLNVTGIASGTTAGVIEFSANPRQGASHSGTLAATADTTSGGILQATAAFGSLWNGASWDRERSNLDVSILASGARTTTQTGADIVNYNGRGIVVTLDMTTVGTGSVTLDIQGKDTIGAKYYTLLTGAAVITNSTNVYRVYPGLTAAANATANDVLPRTYRVNVTANNANSATYSVGASVIL